MHNWGQKNRSLVEKQIMDLSDISHRWSNLLYHGMHN